MDLSFITCAHIFLVLHGQIAFFLLFWNRKKAWFEARVLYHTSLVLLQPPDSCSVDWQMMTHKWLDPPLIATDALATLNTSFTSY